MFDDNQSVITHESSFGNSQQTLKCWSNVPVFSSFALFATEHKVARLLKGKIH